MTHVFAFISVSSKRTYDLLPLQRRINCWTTTLQSQHNSSLTQPGNTPITRTTTDSQAHNAMNSNRPFSMSPRICQSIKMWSRFVHDPNVLRGIQLKVRLHKLCAKWRQTYQNANCSHTDRCYR